MNEQDFEISGVKYKLSKMDAFKQFHIVRRLAPILGDIIPIAQKLKISKSQKSEDESLEEMAALVKPIMDGLSKLSDEDSNRVLLGLLCCVEMQQAPLNNWARVARDEGLMIQTLDLPLMIQLAGRAFMYNMASFFAIAPQVSHGGK